MRIVYVGKPPKFMAGGKRFTRSDSQADRETVVSDEFWNSLSPASRAYFRVLDKKDMDAGTKVSVVEDIVPAFPPKGFHKKADAIRYAEQTLKLSRNSNEFKKNFDKKFALKTLTHNALQKYIDLFGVPQHLKTKEQLLEEQRRKDAEVEEVLVKTGTNLGIDPDLDDTVGTDGAIEV